MKMTKKQFVEKMEKLANQLERIIDTLPDELAEQVITGDIGNSDDVFNALDLLKKEVSKKLR